MLETIALDSHTLIIKSDNEDDLSEIIGTVKQKGKKEAINSFLKFASENRIVISNYKFNREGC